MIHPHLVDTVVDTTGAEELYATLFLVVVSQAWTWCRVTSSDHWPAEVISHVGARPAVLLSRSVSAGCLGWEDVPGQRGPV